MKPDNKRKRKRKDVFRRIWSTILAIALIISFLPLKAFADPSLPFTDVSPGAWYFKDVKNAYEKGLINGKSATKYAPDDQMTYAEAVKLASCMLQQKKEGAISLKNGNPWYQPYVEYAEVNGLVSGTLPWNQAATRAGYMSIFAHVLPDSDASKNNVPDGSIPDVPSTHPNAAAIYKLYRAGIVMGVDAQHNCSPLANIKRSEVAAILTRMTDTSARVTFSMSGGSTPAPAALTITEQPRGVNGKTGEAAELKIRASGGKGKLKYQWQRAKEGSNDYTNSSYPGNTTDTLQAKVEDTAYQYQCVVSDEAGQKITSIAALVKKSAAPLKITKMDTEIGKKVGDPVKLRVYATGGVGKLKYQWYWANRLISGEFKVSDKPSAKTDTLQTVVTNAPYQYQCVVSDESGQKVTSQIVLVNATEGENLKIVKEEATIGKNIGDPATLKIQVSGGKKPLKYQWQWASVGSNDFKNSTFPGNTTNTLQAKIEAVPYQYRCLVKDDAGDHVISKSFLVKTEYEQLKIPRVTSDIGKKVGEPAILTVIATGGKGKLKYRWDYANAGSEDYKQSTYPGNNTNTLQAKVEAKEVKYQCVVTDEAGTEVMSPFFYVGPEAQPLKIVKEDADFGSSVGSPMTLKVQATGGVGKLKYQWQWAHTFPISEYKNSTFPGNDTDTLKGKVEPMPYKYRCVVTDEAGNQVISKSFMVSASLLPLTITTTDVIIGENIGDAATLSIKATGGSGKLKYQWQWALEDSGEFKNSTYPGNDTNTLKAKVEDTTYKYRCVVTDEAGHQGISEIFIVKTPVKPLQIVEFNGKVGDKVGDEMILQVIVTGGKGKLKYQWQWAPKFFDEFKNSTYPGNNTNTLKGKVESLPYRYRCVITDEDGKQLISDIILIEAEH